MAKKKATKSKAKKTTAERARRVKASYETLKKAMPAIGETAGVGDGLEALAGKVKAATVLTPDMELPVGSVGSIYPEDAVAVTYEPVKVGDALHIVTAGAKLLGAAELTSDLVVVCFTQDGKTYIKAMRWDDTSAAWTLGPTCVLVERELDKVAMVAWGSVYDYGYGTYSVAVFYQEEDAGMVQFWEPSWPCNMVHKGTDIWTDQSPVNFCGAWTPVMKTWTANRNESGTLNNSLLTIAYMGSDGSFRLVGIVPTYHYDSESKTSYYSAEIWAEKTVLPGEEYTGATVKEPLEWTNRDGGTATEQVELGKHSDFTVAPPDAQEYANSAWHLTSGIGSGAMWLTYPGTDGERYALEIWCLTDTMVTPAVEYKYAPAACRKLIQKGYQACGAGFYGFKETNLGRGPFFFGSLSRLSGPNQKISVGVECWCGGFFFDFTPLVFGEEDQGFGGNIGLIDVCATEPDMIAVGYAAENVYRMFLLGWPDSCTEREALGGPTVEIAGVGTAARLVRCGDGIAVCYQNGSDIYLQYAKAKKVAVGTRESRFAVGQAVTGGRPGQTIKIKNLA